MGKLPGGIAIRRALDDAADDLDLARSQTIAFLPGHTGHDQRIEDLMTMPRAPPLMASIVCCTVIDEVSSNT
jgi:hypothetical protein